MIKTRQPQYIFTHYGNSELAINTFKTNLKIYLMEAQKMGIKEIYLVFHPHSKHLNRNDRMYKVNVKDLIADVIKKIKKDNSI